MADRRSSTLNVTSRVDGPATIITPVGDVDLTASPILRQEIKRVQATAPKRLIVDLASVGYMDSSGLATLIEAMQFARKSGTRIVLCTLSARVRSIFEIARLDSVFVIAVDLDEARTK